MALVDKLKDLAKGREEQISQAVHKAGDAVNARTGGKYSHHVETASKKVGEVLDSDGAGSAQSAAAVAQPTAAVNPPGSPGPVDPIPSPIPDPVDPTPPTPTDPTAPTPTDPTAPTDPTPPNPAQSRPEDAADPVAPGAEPPVGSGDESIRRTG